MYFLPRVLLNRHWPSGDYTVGKLVCFINYKLLFSLTWQLHWRQPACQTPGPRAGNRPRPFLGSIRWLPLGGWYTRNHLCHLHETLQREGSTRYDNLTEMMADNKMETRSESMWVCVCGGGGEGESIKLFTIFPSLLKVLKSCTCWQLSLDLNKRIKPMMHEIPRQRKTTFTI